MYTKKIINSFFLIVFLASLFISTVYLWVYPRIVHAQAANTATWVNLATISYDGRIFKEDNASDTNWHFYEQNPSDGCADEIKGFNYDPAKGFQTQTVRVYNSDADPGGCKGGANYPITLLDQPPNYNITFVWVDSNNLQSADGKHVFSSQDGKTFTSTTDGACKDFITLGDNPANIILTIRSNTQYGDTPVEHLRNKYGEGYPFYSSIESNGDITLNGESCHEAKTIETTAGDTDKQKSQGQFQGTSGSTGSAKQTCESNNGTIIIGWLVCGFLSLLDQAANKATDVVNSLLSFKAEDITSGPSASKLYNVWSLFRIVSTISLLAVALIMIIGQAMSGD